MSSPLAETFAINNRINIFLLNGIAEAHLSDATLGKGRNVGEQFAHIHNVRLMWLKTASPELFNDNAKIEKEDTLSKEKLITSLNASSEAMINLLTQSEATGKVKGFKPHATAFLGYLLAHEGHHRGQALISLKANGHLPDKKILFGIWEWGVR